MEVSELFAGYAAVQSIRAGLFAAGLSAVLAGASCTGETPSGGTSTLVAALTGSALRDEMRSLRVVVFDLTAQGCIGHRVADPGLAPLATSGLVRSGTFQTTLEVPAGPRTIYVEVYRNEDGTDRFGTGCLEVVLAAGGRATVRIEIEVSGGGDADGDADADADVLEDAGDFDAEDTGGTDIDGEEADGLDAENDGVEPEDVDAWDAPADEPDEGAAPEDVAEEDASPPPPAVVISEIDYDQTGTDNMEFIELYNADVSPVPCSGLEIRLVNGVGSAVYRTQALTCTSLAPGAFHVLGSTALLASILCPSTQVLGTGGTDLIQNGPSSTTEGDAVALIDRSSGTPVVLDQVAYEGLVAGWGEGSPAPTDDATGESLQRIPLDRDRNENSLDFTVGPPTACAAP